MKTSVWVWAAAQVVGLLDLCGRAFRAVALIPGLPISLRHQLAGHGVHCSCGGNVPSLPMGCKCVVSDCLLASCRLLRCTLVSPLVDHDANIEANRGRSGLLHYL